jgi:2-haloacid dehalogenase
MATNGIPEVQEPRIEKSGVGEFFDGVFISERIGYQKPDKRFFDACFERIKDFKKEEAIIVGDSLSSDIKGGINAGILTCHFNPKDKPYGEIKPDYKIKNLSELIPLLDNIK